MWNSSAQVLAIPTDLVCAACSGIMAVFVTPNLQIAAILFAFINVIFNLFAGFVIPRPNIPGWWIW